MANIVFDLMTEKTAEGCEYSIVCSEERREPVNLYISVNEQAKGEEGRTLGIDLNADECEALGRHLLAVSERLRRGK